MNQRQRLLEQIRQQSIQKRAQALREAAQRQANNAPIAAAAGASSGGGRRGCTERDGITIAWRNPEYDVSFIQRAFLPYTGQDESGNATFGLVTDQFIIDLESSSLSLQIRKSGEQWLTEVIFSGDRGNEVYVIAESSDLYEGWIGLPPRPFDNPIEDITATCGDQTYRRLCITTQDDSPLGTYTNITGGVEAIIPEISEEYPSSYGGFNGEQLYWDPKVDRWSIVDTIIEEADDISQPPIGQFKTEKGQVTIVEGDCTSEIPTPPGPTLVTTSDIQLSTTGWEWSDFSGTGKSAGSIAPFIIDGQSGYVGGGWPPPLSPYVFLTTPGEDPNQYTITLLDSASGQVQLGIDRASYNLVSMVLNITVGDGTSPIDQSSGVVLAISGTITYEA
jgi:hypothetical protein